LVFADARKQLELEAKDDETADETDIHERSPSNGAATDEEDLQEHICIAGISTSSKLKREFVKKAPSRGDKRKNESVSENGSKTKKVGNFWFFLKPFNNFLFSFIRSRKLKAMRTRTKQR
jgi:hypothetical protein